MGASVKTLILMRHAKSAWPDGVSDFDRPLNERGQKNAPRMAKFLSQEGYVPDLVLVSPAKRTQETWSLMKHALKGCAHQTSQSIYEASAQSLLNLIHAQSDEVNTLMLVGHNPATEVLALGLASRHSLDLFPAIKLGFPTAGVAVLQAQDGVWRNLGAQGMDLLCFSAPKLLDI